ncbi:hypothetical protein BIU82_18375 [Arthrobacter sp. SW1]|uniref:DUF4839 domain-containing protein n=1 Tax=Arthrobacter sp. SW1 TaxID=1920889 RepID=UPI000877C34B|nr:DUF4839 domain-containing protein [Arthrobacter sp. SW1]OFI38254.1 hypothetical protein BIU82_18375 [Arthrobacter sp. SW1]
MKKVFFSALLATALLTGCDEASVTDKPSQDASNTSKESKEAASKAPLGNYVGKNLAEAREHLEGLGYAVDVKSTDGATIILESNWNVTAQSPKAGGTGDTVVLTAAKPEKDLTASSEQDTGGSETEAVITAKTSKELAALLVVPDNCDDSIAGFASKYEGRTIEFDGSIANMINHGSYKTRYDILLYPGDLGSASTTGPAFKFEDVGIHNLNLQGKNIPAYVGVDDKLHIVANVGEFKSSQCLFFLEPVSTEVR